MPPAWTLGLVLLLVYQPSTGTLDTGGITSGQQAAGNDDVSQSRHSKAGVFPERGLPKEEDEMQKTASSKQTGSMLTPLDIRTALQLLGLGHGQKDQIEAALYGHPGGKPSQKPERTDFAVAIPTHYSVETRVAATRASRLGLKTHVVTNYTPGINSPGPVRYPAASGETWAYYPDDEPVRSYSKGDTRAAMAPFLAFRELGATFKWLFLGDDDTLFMVDAARQIAEQLDPEMPIFLTDNAWFSGTGGTFHPHKEALRCVPCNYAKNMSQVTVMNMTRGCPCTPEVMCNLKNGYKGLLNPNACGAPRAPSISYSMHSGSGALFSIGLLKKVPFEKMEECILSQWNTAADSYITFCLWQMGVAMTDPDPLYHPEGLTMFDPVPEPYNTDENIIPKAAHFLGNLLRQSVGSCSGLCQLELDHTVSLHLRGTRVNPNARSPRAGEIAAQAVLRALARYYAIHLGAIKAGDNLSWLQDAPNRNETLASYKIDARVSAGQQLVQDMSLLFEESSTVGQLVTTMVDPVLSRSASEVTVKVGIMDKARTGAATAIARQVLEIILQDARGMERH